MKRKRIKTLLLNDINLYAWHLPLDVHSELGNNVQLAKELNIKINRTLHLLVLQGEFNIPIHHLELKRRLKCLLNRPIMHYYDANAPEKIKNLAWCTGSGQHFIELAANAGVDAFISGEISEQTIHIVREMKLHFYNAGHHATERGGIRALGEWLSTKHHFDVIFIDIDNPV